MMKFAMLTRLSPDASHAPDSLRALERDVVARIESECPSLRWLANYVVLGNHNYFDLLEVPDVETAIKVSLLVRAYGPAHTEIWPLLEWTDFKRSLDRTAGVRSREPRTNGGQRDRGLAEAAIGYLRKQGAAFRLTNYPLPEQQPAIAHALRPGAHDVTTRVVLVDGRPAIACVPSGSSVNMARLGSVLGGNVLAGSPDDLPGAFRGASEPIPPLGHLIGVPLFVDEQLTASIMLAFHAFSSGVCIEVAYEDFARIEQPKILPLATAGSLPAAAPGASQAQP
jgi:prolyl-tRNA editing enzyme YbaK/EbsC (Cys-tRNA(Pro) deacylase)/uncharacterized protein with GYD domain